MSAAGLARVHVDRQRRVADALADVPRGLLVDGEWRQARSGEEFVVDDPATGRELCTVADGGEDDIADAGGAALRAQRDFAATTASERAGMLDELARRVVARREQVATLIALEMGKPLDQALSEVDYGVDFLTWFSDQARQPTGQFTRNPNGGGHIAVMHEPVGPCLLLTPWNFPLAMVTRKLAPALASGCASVLKPAESTPLTALLLAQLAQEAGVPDGVVNVVPTSRPAPVTAAAIDSGVYRKLSFTGSTTVGRHLAGLCAPHLMRTSLELGGNAPFIVFEDADLGRAVEGALLAKMRNMGQSCTAANRFLVARPVLREFTALLRSRLLALHTGDGLAPQVDAGPLITAQARGRVAALVDQARAQGARVDQAPLQLDGELSAERFFPPTLLTDVPADASVLEQEVFGPVAPIVAFDHEAEAVALANATEYGLSAFVFTESLGRAARVMGSLRCGMVALNQGVVSNAAAPFGGVKQSGLGREGGSEGLAEFLDTKYVAIGDARPGPGRVDSRVGPDSADEKGM